MPAARPDALAAKTSHGEAERSGRASDEQRLREDRSLFERFANERDPVDREILVERFLPLARSLAQRYVRAGEAFDDVFQVACVGLVNAIDRYDLSRGGASPPSLSPPSRARSSATSATRPGR
jgi:DNA-directed RNA polymerase sigma subunit (sigma70/sigma32)